MLCGINLPFERLSPTIRQVTHVLLTRPPLIHSPKRISSLDLHVLSTPPAFVLSQDQTLMLKSFEKGKKNLLTDVELGDMINESLEGDEINWTWKIEQNNINI